MCAYQIRHRGRVDPIDVLLCQAVSLARGAFFSFVYSQVYLYRSSCEVSAPEGHNSKIVKQGFAANYVFTEVQRSQPPNTEEEEDQMCWSISDFDRFLSSLAGPGRKSSHIRDTRFTKKNVFAPDLLRSLPQGTQRERFLVQRNYANARAT